MADYFDVAAHLRQPDIVGSYQQGLETGRKNKEYRQQQEDRNAFRTLAPQILAGDAGAYRQAAAINPDVANKYQEAADGQTKKLTNMARYMETALGSKNPQAVNGAWRSVRSGLINAGIGTEADFAPEWQPEYEQYVHQVLAMGQATGGGNVQSTYVDSDGNRVAIMRDGSTQVLGRNDAGANQQTLTIDVNGVPTQVTFDRRTGRYTNASLGESQAPQTVPTPGLYNTPNGPASIDTALTPEQWQLVQADMANSGAADSYQLPSRDLSPQQYQGGTPLVGRSKEAEAAAVEAAKQQTQLQYLPQELGMRTQAALGEAQGKSEIEQAAKRQALQAENDRSFSLYDTAMSGVIEGLDGASTGPISGRLPALTASQQKAEGGVAAIAPVLKQLFRSAGEGTFTDKDQELLLAMIPTRTDLEEARNWKIENIDRIVREKLGQAPKAGTQAQAPAGQGGGQPLRVQSADDYNRLPSGALYTDPNGFQRRKR